MDSRAKKILMLLNNNKMNQVQEIDNNSDTTCFEENEPEKTVSISNIKPLTDCSSLAMVETWIDNNLENQDPEVTGFSSEALETPLINAFMDEEEQGSISVQVESAETVPLQMINATTDIRQDFVLKVQNGNLENTNTPIINATTDLTNKSNSSNNGDYSPSEGSEYKPEGHTKHNKKNVYCNRSRSSSSSDSSSSDSSSSSSSDSSSSSSSSSADNSSKNKGANQQPSSILIVSEDRSEQETNKRQSRKRQRNPNEWKQAVSKRLKNCGKEYITKRGQTAPAKSLGPPCKSSCRLSCATKVLSEKRNDIFKSYWALGTHQRQRDFLASCVKRQTPATRRLKISTANNACIKPARKPNSTFHFVINGNDVRVCKTFLLNTLSIGEKTLRNVANKVSDQEMYIMSPADNRGKHGKQRKLSDEVLKSVHDHINSIPRTDSHYLRANTTREYIDGSLTIAELHRDYQKIREAAGKEFANYDAYFRIFNSDFNIGLFVPRKDQCDECEAYKNAIDKQPLQDKYKKHLEEKSLSRIELKKDLEQCKNDSNTIVAIFDLQAVLPCPLGQSSAFYYKSKLNCYNFTVTTNDDKTICYFWHEGLGKRGANEIGSCLYKFLEEISSREMNKDIILYSDNCCGQQKNRFVFGMYYHAVNTLPINSITHKFLIRGHTQNKADAVHSVIEKTVKRAKKAGPIYTPAEYISLIKNAKKTGNIFRVQEMNYDSFFDLKLLSDDVNLNLNKDTDGNNFKTTDLKAIKFTKNSETYSYMTSYKTDKWTEAKTRTGRSGNKKKNITLKSLYTTKLPIPNQKKEDIRQLINSNIIPKFYEQYYNSIF